MVRAGPAKVIPGFTPARVCDKEIALCLDDCACRKDNISIRSLCRESPAGEVDCCVSGVIKFHCLSAGLASCWIIEHLRDEQGISRFHQG